MQDTCPCVGTQQIPSNPTVTSAVTFDGSSLACISFSSGNVNDLAVAINAAICTLQTAIANISVTTDGTVLININTNCLHIADGQTVTQALNAMLTAICDNTTAIANLNTDEVAVINIPIANCFGITNGMSTTQALNLIIAKLCPHILPTPVPNNVIPLPVPASYGITLADHDEKVGIAKTPFIAYVKSAFSYTDTSGGGTAKVTLPALDYFVDDLNINQASEQISLISNSDNYIFIDNSNLEVYNVSAVAIGNPAPTVTGAIICKVETGTGTVTSGVQIIANYPIDNTLLQDNSVMKRNLNADTVDAAGGIGQNGSGAYKINVDNSTTEIGLNNIIVKKIYKTNLGADVVGNGLAQNDDGSLKTNVANSITNSGGANQLVGDTASGVNTTYGDNASGARGMKQDAVMIANIPISHAAILTMGVTDTPIDVLPCPTGKTIKIFDMTTNTNVGWVAYATNTVIQAMTDTANIEQVYDDVILTSTVARTINGKKQVVAGTSDTQADTTSTEMIINKDVFLSIKKGDPTGGAVGNVLTLNIFYSYI